MKDEHGLRDDLRIAGGRYAPEPRPDLADHVLRRNTVRRLRISIVAGVVVLGLIAATPAVLGGRPETYPRPPASSSSANVPSPGTVVTEMPRPGGGPMVVHAYTDHMRGGWENPVHFLLDMDTGEYVEVPYAVVPSPDPDRIAVFDAEFDDDNGRAGIADRAEFLNAGEEAVTWIDLPSPSALMKWSPDGTAILTRAFMEGREGGSGPEYTAFRYDIATGRVTEIPLPDDRGDLEVHWAPDSRRLLVMDRDVGDKGLFYVDEGGEVDDVVDVDALGATRPVAHCSPSGRYVYADFVTGVPDQYTDSGLIVDLETEKVRTVVPGEGGPVGWYDEQTVIRLVTVDGYMLLELVDIVAGQVTETLVVPPMVDPRLGPSAGLSPMAADLGF